MANRLEEEFPRTSWRVVAPVGPRGQERAGIRRHVTRGRRLRREAAREAWRRGAPSLVRILVVLAMSARGVIVRAKSLRGAGRGLATRPREPDCLVDPARGA